MGGFRYYLRILEALEGVRREEVIKTNLVKTVTTCHLSHLSGALWSFLLAEKEMIQETVLTAFYYQIKILSWTPRSEHDAGSCHRIITQDHIMEKRKIVLYKNWYWCWNENFYWSHDEGILSDCLILWVDGILPREPINMDPTLSDWVFSKESCRLHTISSQVSKTF